MNTTGRQLSHSWIDGLSPDYASCWKNKYRFRGGATGCGPALTPTLSNMRNPYLCVGCPCQNWATHSSEPYSPPNAVQNLKYWVARRKQNQTFKMFKGRWKILKRASAPFFIFPLAFEQFEKCAVFPRFLWVVGAEGTKAPRPTAYMHICAHICAHVCAHICIYVPIYACVLAYAHVCPHILMYACIYACMHAYKRICVHMCAHICIYARIYAHIYAYMLE